MDQDDLILKSFKNFAIKNKLVQEIEIELIIDNVLSSYIINTIRQFYLEYDNHKTWFDDNGEEQFDIENFSDIIEAFMPGFCQIKRNEVCKWLVDLKKKIESIESETGKKSIESETGKKNIETAEPAETITIINQNKIAEIELDPEIKFLAEIFPNLNIKEIKKAFKESQNDKNKAIELLLIVENKISTDVVYRDNDLTEEDKKQLKEKTLQKFSMVKVNEDGSPIEARPRFVWNEEKKLCRYYESKIVSTKGEKKFEYKTEKEEELEKQMKKTYINLKPARKYRFH